MSIYRLLFKQNNNKWALLDRPFAYSSLNTEKYGQYLSTMWFNHLIKEIIWVIQPLKHINNTTFEEIKMYDY